MQFRVDDMVCDACARSVRRAIQDLDPDAVLTIDVNAHRVNLQTRLSPEAVSEALGEAGFSPVPVAE